MGCDSKLILESSGNIYFLPVKIAGLRLLQLYIYTNKYVNTHTHINKHEERCVYTLQIAKYKSITTTTVFIIHNHNFH